MQTTIAGLAVLGLPPLLLGLILLRRRWPVLLLFVVLMLLGLGYLVATGAVVSGGDGVDPMGRSPGEPTMLLSASA